MAVEAVLCSHRLGQRLGEGEDACQAAAKIYPSEARKVQSHPELQRQDREDGLGSYSREEERDGHAKEKDQLAFHGGREQA